MWVLLIMTVAVSSGDVTAMATIPGYITERDCYAAGQALRQMTPSSLQIGTFCVPGGKL
jgi:hypothetical protein